MIRNLLDPRSEVLTGRLQGVIDIERVSDPKRRALEARTDDFFASTFVSGEIRQLVVGLHRRLNSTDAETGLFLAEGHKGEGKSHVLLVALHLVNQFEKLQDWLKKNNLTFTPPEGTRVIWRKFTDFPLESLWGVIAEELKIAFPKDIPPNINEFRSAIGDKKLVLIFDELESGIRAIPNPALQQQNLNFLQMLSEEANRAGSNIALVASIYDGGLEPGLTLKRVARVELRFQNTTDRRKILFHRLFAKSPLDPSPEIDAIIQSHLNTWRRFGVSIPPDYADDFRSSFPFLPEVLEVVLERIRTLRGGFQGTRGALGFLAALVRARCDVAHLISLADASILDLEMRSWLADLDPAQNLLTCAEANLRELRNNPFADQIASAVLLASLAPSPKEQGIMEDELSRQIVGPESEYNSFRLSLTNFIKYGSFFHERSGSLYFDTKENAHSKVNLRSLSIQDDEAWERVASWWANDILRDSDLVVFSEPASTQQLVEARAYSDIRLVAASRRLSTTDIRQFYFGLKRRNTVILIEPRDEKVNLRANDSLLAYAKRWMAADNLSRTAADSTRSAEFSRIGAEERRYAIDYLKKTNFAYVQILRYGATDADCEFQRENLPTAASREQIVQHIGRNLYPPAFVQEHIADRIATFLGRKVGQVESDYQNTPSFPILTSHSVFLEAISTLVEQGTVIGLRHPAGDVCGRRPALSSDQIADAIIAEPFQVISGGPTPSRPQPTLPFPSGDSSVGGAGAGNSGEFPNPRPTPAPDTDVETHSTGFLPTRQQVRQEIARVLEENNGKTVLRVRLALTFDQRQLDVISLPSFLRGTLTGNAAFAGEEAIDFAGPLTKAQVEEMVERLPDYTPGACRVTLYLQTQAEVARG